MATESSSSSTPPASAAAAAPATVPNISTPAQAMQHYRNLLAGCQELLIKISELEQDRNEHLLVEETLQPLDPQRRAFRLVGEVLVERTVGEVLPTVAANRDNLNKTIEALRQRMEKQQKDAAEIKEKFNLQDS